VKLRNCLFLQEVDVTKGSDLQRRLCNEICFHSCCGHLVVSVNSVVCLGLGYENASGKGFINYLGT
jgi:hypothetical protein